jgi:hypothetical protein
MAQGQGGPAMPSGTTRQTSQAGQATAGGQAQAQTTQTGQPAQGQPGQAPAGQAGQPAQGQPGQGGQSGQPGGQSQQGGQQNQGGGQQGGHNPNNLPDIVGFSFKEADTPERQQLLQGLQQLLQATKQHQRPGDSMTVHYADGSMLDVVFDHDHPQGVVHQKAVNGKQCPFVPARMGTV